MFPAAARTKASIRAIDHSYVVNPIPGPAATDGESLRGGAQALIELDWSCRLQFEKAGRISIANLFSSFLVERGLLNEIGGDAC